MNANVFCNKCHRIPSECVCGHTVKEFFNKITDVSNVPFAMAVLNDNGEITEFGHYQVDFAHEIPHIPLYTTPQIKELSDEEIIKVFESPFQPNTTGKINDEVIAFARAILKKASEK